MTRTRSGTRYSPAGLARLARRTGDKLVARTLDLDGRRFDRRFGVETGGTAEPKALHVPVGEPTQGFSYVATSPRLARFWLGALPRDASQFSFVDMGSGKGRVLLIAAEHGFRRSIGVEFAAELHEVALANAVAARAHGLEIEPVLGDAARFEFPDDDLVVHFNNPFSEPVMEAVLANLTASYGARPRPVVVVYQLMTFEDNVHRTKNLELLDGCPFLTGRRLAARGWIDRRVLCDYTVAILESPETSHRSRTAPGHPR
jgi:SAM-dependent methyltransferase